MAIHQVKAVIRRVSFVVLATVTVTPSLLACLQEKVTYGPFTTRELSGRILPDEGDEVLPGTKLTFIVREKGEDDETLQVPVQADGRFTLDLPEGLYEFTINVEGFLFTLVGDVTIRRDADSDKPIDLRPPWC